MNKFLTLFKFEIKYWLKNPATYVYAGVLFALSILIMAGNLGVFDSNTATVASIRLANSPIALFNSFGALALGYFLLPSIIGGSVYRDFSSDMHSILYSYPFKKSQYIPAKFLSSVVITLCIFLVFALGFMIAQLLPGVNADLLGKFRPLAYLQVYGLFILPNVLLLGAIVFAVISFTRNMSAGFITIIVVFIIQSIADSYMGQLENKTIGALLDPFGNSAMSHVTEYWSVTERNTNLLPLGGVVLYNRLIWIAVSILLFALTYIKFSFSQSALSFRLFKRKSKVVIKDNFNNLKDINLPKVTIDKSFSWKMKLIWNTSLMHLKFIFKSIPFWVFLAFGILFIIIGTSNSMVIFGTETHPVTWKMLLASSEIFKFFLLMITFLYSGMLVQRERRAKMFELVDATQTPNGVQYFSKFIALILMQIALLFVVMITSITIQIASGYYNIEILHYLTDLFIFTLPFYIVWAALSIFVQSLFSNFYIGFFTLFIFNIALNFATYLGIEQQIFRFNAGPSWSYSDMNGYGNGVAGYFFYRLYWLFGGGVLLIAGLGIWRRGMKESIKVRFRRSKENLTKSLYISISICLIGFLSIGSYIYWFDNIKNDRKSSKERELTKVEWENKYSKYQGIPQPRITDANINVEIYPETKDFKIDGNYIIKNKSNVPIDSLHINYSYKHTEVDFSRTASIVNKDTVYQYNIYQLSEALQPGDSMQMHFTIRNEENHFLAPYSTVIENGTFFNNMRFPMFGYSKSGELTDNTVRKKYGLPKRERMAEPTDSSALGNTYISECADWVNFETTVSTASDQIAIAPGYLQKHWIEGNRAYFHYKMDAPILNFYSWVSGRYEVLKDEYDGVNIEIYYHKGHEYNLDDMVASLKASLKYYTENFGPYQHKQVRIIEFPRTKGTFAQSFPNTIPYSEAIGFIAKEDESDEGTVNYAYHVTAHELAHQWWAHQVIGANVKGATLMSESLAEYSAIKVLEQKYPKHKIRKFMAEELNGYLRGRGYESVKEQPLMYNENQQYIHYNKGAVAMYAISDYIGEKNLSNALKEYINNVAFQEPPYTTSLEFVDLMKRHTPDSLDYIITDLLETITLFDNKIDSTHVTELDNGKYKVDFIVDAQKYRVIDNDKSQFNQELETEDKNVVISLNVKTGEDDEEKEYIDMNDWVDVAIFGEDDNKEEEEILFKKVHLTQQENKFSFIIDQKPSSVGVDPYHKLIDRKTYDNTMKVKVENTNLNNS